MKMNPATPTPVVQGVPATTVLAATGGQPQMQVPIIQQVAVTPGCGTPPASAGSILVAPNSNPPCPAPLIRSASGDVMSLSMSSDNSQHQGNVLTMTPNSRTGTTTPPAPEPVSTTVDCCHMHGDATGERLREASYPDFKLNCVVVSGIAVQVSRVAFTRGLARIVEQEFARDAEKEKEALFRESQRQQQQQASSAALDTAHDEEQQQGGGSAEKVPIHPPEKTHEPAVGPSIGATEALFMGLDASGHSETISGAGYSGGELSDAPGGEKSPAESRSIASCQEPLSSSATTPKPIKKKVPGTVHLSPSYVCRLHAGGRCRFGVECRFAHICSSICTTTLRHVVHPMVQGQGGGERPGKQTAPGQHQAEGMSMAARGGAMIRPPPPQYQLPQQQHVSQPFVQQEPPAAAPPSYNTVQMQTMLPAQTQAPVQVMPQFQPQPIQQGSPQSQPQQQQQQQQQYVVVQQAPQQASAMKQAQLHPSGQVQFVAPSQLPQYGHTIGSAAGVAMNVPQPQPQPQPQQQQLVYVLSPPAPGQYPQ